MKLRRTKYYTHCDRCSRWAAFDYQMADESCACLCETCLAVAMRQEIDTLCRRMAAKDCEHVACAGGERLAACAVRINVPGRGLSFQTRGRRVLAA